MALVNDLAQQHAGAVALLTSLIETDDAGRIWLADDPGPTAGRIADSSTLLGGSRAWP
jgi:hypothetical protein